MSELPGRLAEIVDEFSDLSHQERLEYLLYYAGLLPPLPEWLEERRDQMEPVPECMTPVFLYAEKDNGRLRFHLDVPDQSPTVRGFAAILQAGLSGQAPADILRVPADFYLEMGLQRVLSSQRIHGLLAILAHMKQLAAQHVH
ncbi:MAG: SufE family protein [Candidatus Promineifilaceae bacterium]